LLKKPHTGFLDSEAQPFGCSVRLARSTRIGLVATVFPEFIARDGQERA